MRTYVLVRADGKYVAQPGSQNSYTTKLERARTFPTRDAAEADRCVDNESIREISEIVGKGR